MQRSSETDGKPQPRDPEQPLEEPDLVPDDERSAELDPDANETEEV